MERRLVYPSAAGNPADGGATELWRSSTTRLQRIMICWFGIRGVGSMYYLMYGITMGVEPSTARLFIGLTLATIAMSIIVHGLSVTPMMKYYLEKTSTRTVN
ncbi:MAG: hypothetical protein ACREX3_21985 [Gammaproteobacteria bacterium]